MASGQETFARKRISAPRGGRPWYELDVDVIRPDFVFRIVLVGERGVGKTQFVETVAAAGGTITSHFGKLIRFEFIECPSDTGRPGGVGQSFCGVDGVIVLYDTTDENSFSAVEEWVSLARFHTEWVKPSVVVLGNKCDLASQRKVQYLHLQHLTTKLQLEPFNVTQISCIEDGPDCKLMQALRELSDNILCRISPTCQIEAKVVGHEIRQEEEEDAPWYKKQPRSPARWYEFHKRGKKAEKVAYYTVRCKTVDGSLEWEVAHRYTHFCELHGELTSAHGLDELPMLPTKHIFAGSADPEVIRERELGLAEVVNAVVDEALAYPVTQDFFHIPQVEAQLKQDAKIQGRIWLSEAKGLSASSDTYDLDEEMFELLGNAHASFRLCGDDKSREEVLALLSQVQSESKSYHMREQFDDDLSGVTGEFFQARADIEAEKVMEQRILQAPN